MTDFGTLEIRAAWTEAFVKAQHGLINPPKTQRVSTGKFSYSYASLPDIIDSIRTVLAEQGLAVAQSVEAGASGYVGVTTTIYHSAGHSETFGPLLLPAGSTPQEAGSAITYARRYSLCAALNIAADEDDDGAKVSQRPSAGVAGKGKVSAPAEGTTSDAGESRSEVEGELPVSAEYPAPGDVPASGTSDHAAAGAAPDPSTEVSARGASKPVCSVNGPRHKPDAERSAKARPGFVVCARGDAAPTAEAAAQWAPVEQVTV